MERAPAPMKATAGELPPAGEAGWTYEVKWDGHRVLAVVDHGTVKLWSANGLDATARFPGFEALAGAVHADRAVLDGEMVAFDAEGRPSFSALQTGTGALAYLVFDVLEVDGDDLRGRPWRERRARLEQALSPGAAWQLSPVHDDGVALLEAAKARGLEGVMAKRVDSTYLPGRRTTAWRKVKVRGRAELVVGGWLDGTGHRSTTFGSLLVGFHDERADGLLVFAGAVGSGFTEAAIADLWPRLTALATDTCPFAEPLPREPRLRGHWVRPELVIEVAFTEWTHDGHLRHPVHLGLRMDKAPDDVRAEPWPPQPRA